MTRTMRCPMCLKQVPASQLVKRKWPYGDSSTVCCEACYADICAYYEEHRANFRADKGLR